LEGVAELWFDERIGDWWASYRLLADEGGVPIVGEIRIYPYATSSAPGGDRWTGFVPAGGIPATVLRRVTARAPFSPNDWRRLMKRHPAAPLIQVAAKVDLSAHRAGQTVPPALLAKVADTYVECCIDKPKSPITVAARRLNLSPRYVKFILGRAREEGYLTSLGRGRSGGAITKKATALLEDNVHQKGTSG
jgi:hypothetical protein